jgi:alpha-L-rhamnosidase
VGGLYELSVNGQTIGDRQLDRAFTRFDRRILYQTYDVTKHLQTGENVLGVLLGNGWYNHQSTAVWYFHQAPWRNRPAFCLNLRLTYQDGTVETISSNTNWKTSLSPIVFNSIYTAEHYDARLEQPGWNQPGFNDKDWKAAEVRPTPSNNIVAQVMHPIRITETLPAQSIQQFNDTTWVYDLGLNISGISSLTISGPAGTVIRLKHGEQLYPDGRVDLSNIDVHYRPTDNSDPFQTDIFILKGEGQETFRPRFNYKGFQYVEVTASKPIQLDLQSLQGHFMHSDVPPAGSFKSSNELLNKIWQATNNSYLSNLFGYPTDCPQREKNGWTGDGHIAIETGLYSFDGITVYEKWLVDHQDEQQPSGVLPAIIPTSGWGYQWANGPDWTSTIALIPWNLYLFYGDTTILSRIYPNLKRYVDLIDQRYPDGLTDWGLGDWVPVKTKSSVELTSSIYFFTDASILARIATLLDRQEEAAHYQALAGKIKTAINQKYLDREQGIYASGTQTELSTPLFWGIVPKDLRTKVAASLANRVKADGAQLDVGLLGTKAILNALSENGYPELAYTLAARDQFPSWGWWIVNGATTLYENWPVDATRDISRNHIMFGEIGAWMYKALAGIKPDPENPGFKQVVLEPHFIQGLDWVEAEHEGPYGPIKVNWKRQGKKILLDLLVPPNSGARLVLPVQLKVVTGKKQVNIKENKINTGKQQIELEAGQHAFVLQ